MSNYFLKLDRLEMALRGKTHSVTFTTSLASPGTTYLQIKTGSATCVILDWHIGAIGQPIQADAIESPTVTNGTTVIPSYKTNRQETGSAVTLFYSNPTNISGGTTIFTEQIPSDKGTGGTTGNDHVWVLKKNTSYIWKLTNLGNNTATVDGGIYFAETLLP